MLQKSKIKYTIYNNRKCLFTYLCTYEFRILHMNGDKGFKTPHIHKHGDNIPHKQKHLKNHAICLLSHLKYARWKLKTPLVLGPLLPSVPLWMFQKEMIPHIMPACSIHLSNEEREKGFPGGRMSSELESSRISDSAFYFYFLFASEAKLRKGWLGLISYD